MKGRVTDFISALLDEALNESTEKASYTPKKGDCVAVIRGAMTGECGEITYVIPGGSMADVKFDSGKVARVSVGQIKKETKKAEEKKK